MGSLTKEGRELFLPCGSVSIVAEAREIFCGADKGIISVETSSGTSGIVPMFKHVIELRSCNDISKTAGGIRRRRTRRRRRGRRRTTGSALALAARQRTVSFGGTAPSVLAAA